MPTINAQLHQLAAINDAELDDLAKRIDVNSLSLYILRELYRENSQHPSVLARAVGRAATSFTPCLDKLERGQLVERIPDPNDRRAVRIVLTAKAEKLRTTICDEIERVEKAMRYQVETILGVAYPQTNVRLSRVQSLPTN